MSLLTEIDLLREAVASLCAQKHDPALAPDERAALLWQIEQHREAINERLAKYHAQSDCPYCPGKLQPTPTKHVLQCDRCLAVTLPGRMAVEIIRSVL